MVEVPSAPSASGSECTASVCGADPSAAAIAAAAAAAAASNASSGALWVGDAAPNFSIACADGRTRRLSDYAGTRVMICFYRHPYCPICRFTVENLIGHYKKLAWATRLEVFTIFAAPLETVKEALSDGNIGNGGSASATPTAKPVNGGVRPGSKRILDKYHSEATMTSLVEQYPFHAGADPDGTIAIRYRSKRRRSFLGTWKDALPFHHARAVVRAAARGEKSVYTLPSEFLIDEHGTIVDIFRAKRLSESIPMERVNNFLLHGNLYYESEDSRNNNKKGTKKGESKRKFLSSSFS